jgi:hypothetical protein
MPQSRGIPLCAASLNQADCLGRCKLLLRAVFAVVYFVLTHHRVEKFSSAGNYYSGVQAILANNSFTFSNPRLAWGLHYAIPDEVARIGALSRT